MWKVTLSHFFPHSFFKINTKSRILCQEGHQDNLLKNCRNNKTQNLSSGIEEICPIVAFLAIPYSVLSLFYTEKLLHKSICISKFIFKKEKKKGTFPSTTEIYALLLTTNLFYGYLAISSENCSQYMSNLAIHPKC